MSQLVKVPIPQEDAVYLSYAVENYETAENILNTLAGLSMVCSLLALYVMIRMKVYKHSLMGIIFVMTVLETFYDAALLSTFCGDPSISVDNGAGIQSTEWNRCRSLQMGVMRGTGIGVGVCTNVISAAVAYVIFYEKRLPLNYTTLAVLVLVPSSIIGTLFGQFFYEQTEAYGMIGFIGGQDKFNIINFVYIAYTTTQFVINAVCVLYTSWHFSKKGLLFAKRQANMQIGRLDSHNLELHNAFDNSDPENRASDDSAGRYTGGPMREERSAPVSRSSSVVRGSASARADAKERFQYPMFLLAKRLMLYPVVQTFVIFGGSFYAFAQDGEATESYVWNVTSNPNRKAQTMQFFFFCTLMPIAGFGYFLVFMAFQKGAWKVLIETFTKELPNSLGLPACTCRCVTFNDAPDAREGVKSSAATDLSTVEEGTLENGTAAPSSPNPFVHTAYLNNLKDVPPPPPESPKSTGSRSPSQCNRNNSVAASPPHYNYDQHMRQNVNRFSYTYEGSENRESIAGSVTGSSIQGDSYGQHSRGRFLDASREDSIAYYEGRIGMLREMASVEARSIAEQLASMPDLCKEDMDEMQEDELIDLIEIVAQRKKEAKKIKKPFKNVDVADSEASSHSGTLPVDFASRNPMH